MAKSIYNVKEPIYDIDYKTISTLKMRFQQHLNMLNKLYPILFNL